MSDAPENALCARFVQGAPEALEALYRRYEAEVFGWVLRIVRSQAAAEEVVAEAFWRA